MLYTLMFEHTLVPFDGKMGLEWIIQELGFHPFLLWESFLGHRSPQGWLRKVFGGWFVTPPKVLRMTMGGGPCCKGFGQGGSKRVKTCPTSWSIFTRCSPIYLAEKLVTYSFWTKKFFGTGFGVCEPVSDPLWPSEHGPCLFMQIFQMDISPSIGCTRACLGCQNFSFESNFLLKSWKCGKMRRAPLQPQERVFGLIACHVGPTRRMGLKF